VIFFRMIRLLASFRAVGEEEWLVWARISSRPGLTEH
jgi:hypothetical protein